MGREQRRKQAKKDGKSLKKVETISDQDIKKVFKKYIIVILSVGLFFVILYLGLGIFVTKEIDLSGEEEKENTTETTTNSVSDSILANSIFKQSEEEYYVYFYDFDEDETTLTELVQSKLMDSKVYKVNTSSSLNKNYVADKGNKDAKTLEELKVVTPTLIKIANDEIVEYYESTDEINSFLD